MMKVSECVRVGSEIEVRFEDDSKKVFSFGVVRGGVAWPTPNSPAYYCMVGRRTCVNKNFKEPLVLFSEYEADLPVDLFQRLYEDARRFFCFEFYADVDEASYEYYNQFYRYMERLNMHQRIVLNQAGIMDWQAGVLCIQKYARDSALDVPEGTILASQLGKMTRADQQDSKKNEFYAVNALRCLIGSFEIPSTSARSVAPCDYLY